MTDANETMLDDTFLDDAGPARPNSIGRRRLFQAAGATAGASALATAIPTGMASAAVPSGASSFVPLPKGVRLADTREAGKYSTTLSRLADNRLRVRVRDTAGVPPEATAVVLTVTGKNFQTVNNYITVFPTGTSIPVASNLNLPRAGELNANLVFVKVGSEHSVDVFQFAPCETIVDVLGYFAPVSSEARAGRFIGLGSAWRALDTRQRADHFVAGNSYTEVDVTDRVPASAASVMINLTSLANPGWGFFSAVPVSVEGVPTTSSLNVVFANDKRAAAVIVPVETVGGRRKFKIYASGPAKLIVDVTGYFTNDQASASTDGLFVSTDPRRVLDTREPAPGKKMWPRWVVEQTLPAPANQAAAVVLNVTAARTLGEGYLTVSGARLSIPGTSNVNWTGPGAIVPNLAVTPVTVTHGFQVFNFSGGHVIADMAGYFTGKQRVAQYGGPPNNPPPPPAAPEWTLRVPRLGLTSRVLAGDGVAITDAGHTWHWTGTGYVGQNAHVAVFGHRTEAGSPYRYLHLMEPGDTWTVTTNDGREFTYRMVRRDLTDAQTQNILNGTRFHPGTTFSFVACTRGYDSSGYRRYLQWYEPTSLRYRLIVTGELVGWREIF